MGFMISVLTGDTTSWLVLFFSSVGAEVSNCNFPASLPSEQNLMFP